MAGSRREEAERRCKEVLQMRTAIANAMVAVWRRGNGAKVAPHGEGLAEMAAAVARAWGKGLGAGLELKNPWNR